MMALYVYCVGYHCQDKEDINTEEKFKLIHTRDVSEFLEFNSNMRITVTQNNHKRGSVTKFKQKHVDLKILTKLFR